MEKLASECVKIVELLQINLRFFEFVSLFLSCNLKKPKYKLKTYGYRAFSVAAPFLWNEPPINLKNSNTVGQIKSGLKTLIFKRAFNL